MSILSYENHAQNDTGNDSDDGNDILHTLQESEPKQVTCYSCYYCDYKTDNKHYYERHIILKHNHCPAYPNKSEIEKRGLKPQGKDLIITRGTYKFPASNFAAIQR